MVNQIDRLQAQYKVTNSILGAIASDKDSADIVQLLKEGHSYESILSKMTKLPGSGEEEEEEEEEEEKEGSTSISSRNSSSLTNEPWAFARNDISGAEYKSDQPHPENIQPRRVGVHSAARVEHGCEDSDANTSPVPFTYQSPESSSTNATLLDDEIYPSTSRSERDDYIDPSDRWTRVTEDNAFIEHLLSLYFCWEYPIFASLSETHFLEDFRAGRRRFCSSLLVNALLCLACVYTDKAEARIDPYNSDTSGDGFFEEAKWLLSIEGGPSLTTIQALGLMSLREASCGRDSTSLYYAAQSIRMAVKLELNVDHVALYGKTFSHDERYVRSATFWGCFCLDQ